MKSTPDRRVDPPLLFDSHCHFDFEPFDVDRPSVEARARAVGVRALVIPGVEPQQWERSWACRSSVLRLGRAVGLHPQAVASLGPEVDKALEAMEAMARRGACAIGELGFHLPHRVAQDGQARIVDVQLELARQLELPVIVHIVRSHGYALEHLRRHAPFRSGGVVHAYSGSAELVLEYVKLGLSVSFGPSVLRTNALKLHRAVRVTPPSHLLIETDGPDQRPVGALRGEPADLREVASAVAVLRGSSYEEVARTTFANAEQLFARAFTEAAPA